MDEVRKAIPVECDIENCGCCNDSHSILWGAAMIFLIVATIIYIYSS